MGSSGSGRISDYPGASKQAGDSRGSSGEFGGAGGSRGGGDDRCAKAFTTSLEDAEHSDYYHSHSEPPPEGTAVFVAHKKRVVAITSDGESVGSLPTSFNYLAACLKDGWEYVGVVRTVQHNQTGVVVFVDFVAKQS
jgi:hypothetical protein